MSLLRSTLNSTTTLLGAGGVFTGSAEKCGDLHGIILSTFSNQAPASIMVEWSQNGVNFDDSDTLRPVPAAGSGRSYNIIVRNIFYRIVYTNTGTPQATFRLNTFLATHPLPFTGNDNANIALGSIVDTAVTTDTDSTLKGHTRGLVKILGDVWDDANNRLNSALTAALPAGTNNIGDVDVLTLPSLPAGTNNIGDVDVASFAAGAITEVQGDVAHDAAAAGNPVLLCGTAETPEDTAPTNQVSAEGDATRLACDRDGALFTHPHPPRIWHFPNQSSAQQTDTVVKAAAGAGLSHYITDIYVAANGAVTITIEEGTTVFKWRYYAAAAGDGAMVPLRSPIKIAANTAITYTTSAAIEHTILVSGYTGP